MSRFEGRDVAALPYPIVVVVVVVVVVEVKSVVVVVVACLKGVLIVSVTMNVYGEVSSQCHCSYSYFLDVSVVEA